MKESEIISKLCLLAADKKRDFFCDYLHQISADLRSESDVSRLQSGLNTVHRITGYSLNLSESPLEDDHSFIEMTVKSAISHKRLATLVKVLSRYSN